MPRPDLEALGINYRRIPLLSIGRSVYCDTRLILEKLETMFEDKPRLSASDPYQRGVERLLESWTIDGGIFNRAGQVLPSTVLPDNLVSPKSHPRAFAYIDHFDGAVKAASSKLGKPTRLQSSKAIAHITSAKYPDPDGSMQIDQNDPMAKFLKQGQTVASWPVDTGFQNKDFGKLVKLDKQELVLEVTGKDGRQGIRIHHPRWNFRVKPVEEARL